MSRPHLPEPSLLKKVLEPLLEDFQYWFERSRTLLETETIEFLEAHEQQDLLHRIIHAQEEVSSAKMMLDATGCQAGVDMSVLMPWHHLLTECWQISMQFRAQHSQALNVRE
ncbi:MAG: DUF2605 domain-containing protein [Sodalinema sp.]|uniref:DUF2605 domain-containing protein n=1 Tax=Sodalinema sp. TaxID=3080550 RepID=UPI00121664E5|nr:MAG: DUF2605 domain-containing protein [Phormidium sp. SL48-SHIP]